MNVPKLRFPEFNDEYNLIVLNDILFSHNAGIYIEKSQYGFGTNIVGVSNLYDNTKIDGQFFRFAPLTEDDKINYLLDENDIIYGESSLVPIGIARTLAVSSKGKNTAFEWHTRRFKINNDVVNSFYLSYMFNFNNKIRKRLASVSTQTALTGITTKDFFSTKFYIPKLEEQNKVVKLIDLLDKKIELQTKKIEDLKLFKKGLIKKFFSENNLKQIKIKEIGEIITGTTPSKSVSNYWDNGNIIWVTPTDINDNRDINDSIFKITYNGLKNGKFIPKNSILVTCIASIGKNAILKVDGSCNQQINAIIPNKNYNYNYIYYLMEFISNYMKSIAGTSATAIINKDDFSKIVVKVHSKERQDYIDSILSQFEDKVLLEKSRLKQLTQLKKGLMQNMFV